MAKDKKDAKKPDPASRAHDEAEKDILRDPDLSDADPTDDLDEGELAQRDNSDEEGLDELEGRRGAGHPPHSGKGTEK